MDNLMALSRAAYYASGEVYRTARKGSDTEFAAAQRVSADADAAYWAAHDAEQSATPIPCDRDGDGFSPAD